MFHFVSFIYLTRTTWNLYHFFQYCHCRRNWKYCHCRKDCLFGCRFYWTHYHYYYYCYYWIQLSQCQWNSSKYTDESKEKRKDEHLHQHFDTEEEKHWQDPWSVIGLASVWKRDFRTPPALTCQSFGQKSYFDPPTFWWFVRIPSFNLRKGSVLLSVPKYVPAVFWSENKNVYSCSCWS